MGFLEIQLGVLIFFEILHVLTAILLIVGFFRFKRLLHLWIVQRRYPRLVLLESVLSTLIIFVYCPLRMLSGYPLHALHQHQRTIDIVTFAFQPLMHIMGYCEACRLWLVRYDLHMLDWTENNAWKLRINSKFGDANWWLKHRQTFGNSRYMAPRMLGVGVAVGLGVGVLYQLHNMATWVSLTQSAMFVVPVFFILWNYYKCPKKGNDLFLFLFEFKYTAGIYCTSLSIYVAAIVVKRLNVLLGEVMMSAVSWFAFSVLSVLSTLWVPKQILARREWSQCQVLKSDTADESTQNDKKSNRLVDTFADHRRLDLFASHLNREFALENLLAFLEFVQFKQHFQQIYFGQCSSKTVEIKSLQITFDFGEHALESEIVFQTIAFADQDARDPEKQNVLYNFKKIAHLLYLRYIRENGELEVNIPSQQRAEFNEMMHRESHWLNEIEMSAEQLLCLFDVVCLELYYLMNGSFYRFKTTAQAKELSVQSTSALSYL